VIQCAKEYSLDILLGVGYYRLAIIMKRCPTCQRVYSDETLNYCLDDGASLQYAPGDSGPITAVLGASAAGEAPTRLKVTDQSKASSPAASKKKFTIIAGIIMLILATGFIAYRTFLNNSTGSSPLPGGFAAASQPQIRSLAVLPLKPLDAGDNYIGMGIADAIIRRISQTGQLTVRPTSSIMRYLNDNTDALTAAKQLDADAVLEGSVQRADDRLRVSVNLLRTSDGTSLWNDSFDLKMTDIFSVQDTVSQQVASRLSLKLDPAQKADLTKRYTSNPIAYEYYQKAIFIFDSRDPGKEKALGTIELLKKAIDADPGYALAHAQLAYAYAEMATFDDPTNPRWAELVSEESDRAAHLDPNLAEIHLAKSLLLWSSYGGFQLKAAIRELIAAQQLDPNVGHAELGGLYAHVGLTDLTNRELQRAVEIDPTSDFVKGQIMNQYWLLGDYDQWAAETHRQFADKATDPENSAWYLLGKGRLDEAEKRIDDVTKRYGDAPHILSGKAILLALKGNFRAAEGEIPKILSKQAVQDPTYHHITFDIACIFALEGKSDEAVKWLRKTAESGYPCYPRFERDPFLDRIRQSPEFVQFIAEAKNDFETYRSEFGRQ
jgi:TolB-like protein